MLTMLSGDPHGEPDWVKQMSTGEDAGFFGPGSAVWHVNGGIPVIAAGWGHFSCKLFTRARWLEFMITRATPVTHWADSRAPCAGW